MANHYNLMAFVTDFRDREAGQSLANLLTLFDALENGCISVDEIPDDFTVYNRMDWNTEWTHVSDIWYQTGDEIYFASEEEFDPDMLVAVLQWTMKRHDINRPQAFSWASTCSKPRPGAFGGGACIVYQDRVLDMTTRQWLDERKGDE